MCGRFALSANAGKIEKLLPGLKTSTEVRPRYNIAPTQNVLAILSDDSKKTIELQWGLIPSWSKDDSIGQKMINARSETIKEKPSFKNLIKRKRCLIIADGYYEWKSDTGFRKKTPYFIKLKSGEPFTFAGLWDEWKNNDGTIKKSCTIITRKPITILAEIHDRMPVIIAPVDREKWLAKNVDQNMLLNFLANNNEEEFEYYPVSNLVNNPGLDNRECILPVSSNLFKNFFN